MRGAMAVAAVVQLSAPRTLRDLEMWFASLPARERADLTWAEPALREVRECLVAGPLTPEALDLALHRYLTISLRIPALRRLLRQDPSLLLVAAHHVQERLHELHGWLESPAAAAVVDQAAHIVKASQEALVAALRDGTLEIPEEMAGQATLDRSDEALQTIVAQPETSIVCAQLLLLGVIECADQGAPSERGRELGRRALLCAIAGLRAFRQNDLPLFLGDYSGASGDVPIHAEWQASRPELSLEQRVDLLLESSARFASLESREALEALQGLQFIPGAASRPPSPGPAPRPPVQVQRLVGEIAGVMFSDALIILRSTTNPGGLALRATPALVERALTLRGQTIAAVVLMEPGGDHGTPHLRVLRLDPAEGPAIPESGERTREMLQQWDELLRRLAR